MLESGTRKNRRSCWNFIILIVILCSISSNAIAENNETDNNSTDFSILHFWQDSSTHHRGKPNIEKYISYPAEVFDFQEMNLCVEELCGDSQVIMTQAAITLTVPDAELRYWDSISPLQKENISASYNHPIYYIGVTISAGTKDHDGWWYSIDGSTIRYITMGDCPPDAEEILPMTIRINIGYCHNGQIDYRHETAGFSYKRLADLELCELAEPIEVPHFRITSLWWRITPIRTYLMGVKEKTDDKKTVWVYYTDENGEQQPVDSLYREHVPDKMAVKVMDHDKLECTIYLIREKNHYIVFESVMEP